jgi:hypothetical protein
VKTILAADLSTRNPIAGVACFVKQLGAKPRTNSIAGYDDAMLKVELKSRKGGDMAEWPADLRVREFPNG